MTRRTPTKRRLGITFRAPPAPPEIVATPTFQALQARLTAIYAQIPDIDCKGLCAASCGPILIAPTEMLNATALATDPIPFTGRVTLTSLDDRDDHGLLNLPPGEWYYPHTDRKGRCPLLKNGRCTVHPNRPLICRLYGVVPEMTCPYGCRPDRWLTPDEVENLKTLVADDETAYPTQMDAMADELLRASSARLHHDSG